MNAKNRFILGFTVMHGVMVLLELNVEIVSGIKHILFDIIMHACVLQK